MSESNEELMLKELYSYYANANKADESSRESLEKHIKGLKDAYTNSVLGIGEADHLAQFNNYTFENNTLNWFLWLAMYNESWVFRRAIDKPSQDMIRPGVSLLGTADFTRVYKSLDSLKPDLINAVKWSKLFGGSVMVLLFKGVKFEDMEKPIEWKKIEGCKYVRAYVTDRWFGCSPSYDDTVSNIANDDFGKPKYYDIQFADGTTHRIHHSWLLRFEGRDAPQLIKTGQLQGWGYAEGSHIFNELQRDEKLKSSLQSLVDKSCIEVIKMSGMRGVFMGADKGNEEQLKKRLEMVNWGRNFNSLTFLDKDDDYNMNGFSGLSGLADVLDLNMRQIAAAVEMPNVLFGDLSNGFTSDDGALERYDDKILNDCDTYLRKPLSKLINILYHMHSVKDEAGKTLTPAFTFNSTIIQKRNNQKLDEISRLIEVNEKLIKMGLIDTTNSTNCLQEYLNTGSINFQFKTPGLVLKKSLNKNKNKANDLDEYGMDEGDISMGGNEMKMMEKPSMPGTKEPVPESKEPVGNEPVDIKEE